MRTSKIHIIMYTICFAFVWSCNHVVKESDETTTKGKIYISADECYKPIIEAEELVFENMYPNAQVIITYKPDGELWKDLNTDSIRMVLTPTSLDSTQLKTLNTQLKFYPKTIDIAHDAIALIVNPNHSSDVNITVNELKKIITGEITTWSQLQFIPQDKTNSNPINVVFDNQNSSTARYMIDSITNKTAFSKNIFGVKTNEEVINYVASHPQSMGVIGVSWVSDMDDSSATQFLKKIKLVGIKKTDTSEAFQPYQAYIATKDYALCRTLKAIVKENGPILGSGFTSFMCGDSGQRIILKSGLVPSTMPIRLVRISDKQPY